jgi:hypothetical protein
VKPRDSAHFSVRYCQTASPEALEERLKQLADGTMRIACINHLEAIVNRVPKAIQHLSEATGPAASFENAPAEQPHRRTYVSRLRSAARSIRMTGRAAIR